MRSGPPTKLFFAEACDYAQLHAALRARAEQLNASRATLDDETGLADGYCAKILAPKPTKGVITRIALEPILKGLRIRLIIVDDPEVAASRGDLPQRDISQVRLNNESRRAGKRAAMLLPPPSQPASPPALTVVPAKRSARGGKYG
jgi:hypothetical protein